MEINPISFLWNIINVIILYFGLKYFLYNPVRNFMQKRADGIKIKMDSADECLKQAEDTQHKYEELVSEGNRIAERAVTDRLNAAQSQADEIIAQSHEKAKDVLDQARSDSQRMREGMKSELDAETSRLAVAIAAKILEREVTLYDQDKLIDDFIAEVGEMR